MSGLQINVTLYVTNDESATTDVEDTVRGATSCVEARNGMEIGWPKRPSILHEHLVETDDLQVPTSKIVELADNVQYTRMNTDTVIQESMQKIGSHQRVLIATCGPKSLMDAVRDSVDICRMDPSSRVDLHCEDFSA